MLDAYTTLLEISCRSSFDLIFLTFNTAVHNGDTKEAWCDQEMISSLLIAVKRGSYDIYKSLVGTGVIGPPDKLMYEEQYLTSVDIVRDLLQVSFFLFFYW